MNFKNDIDQCLFFLNNGGIILYPTDTIWGLGCDATNEKAVAKIYELKKRAETKSMIILLPAINELSNYSKAPNEEIKNLLAKTERPLTIIYPNAKNLAENLVNEDGTIAVRIPKDDFCTALLQKFGKPIVSTSANISGEETATNFSKINRLIIEGVDYFCTHRQDDEMQNTKPSKIIKWNDDESITIIRE
jgi:L-threonylcarbamoyladenylate synthase